MDYHITFDTEADGLLRYDSPEAEKFVGPVITPTGIRLLRVISEMADRRGGSVDVNLEELAGRCGVSEARIKKSIDLLCHRNLASLSPAEGDGATSLEIKQWLNPPRAGVCANKYPPALRDEYKEFMDTVEPELDASATPAVVDTSAEQDSLGI